jgi:hypothetical protein
MTSLLYSANYIGGIGAIAGFIEAILFFTICYALYVKGTIIPSRILIIIIAGFVFSISVSSIQISNFMFNSGFLLPLVDYINSFTIELHHFRITGLYSGDPNVYATIFQQSYLLLWQCLYIQINIH